MSWEVIYLPEAAKDISFLSHRQQIIVKKAIDKVQKNPLPQSEGGYGKPLGNKNGMNLSSLLKIKLRGEGLRIVYKLYRFEGQMLIIVVGVRDDEEAYRVAALRRMKHDI